MTAKPTVSVVSVFYNRADTVARSLGSILTQSFKDFEYIVVDDASTDDTAAHLKAITDPRLAITLNQTNIGFTRSLAAATRYARGEFLALHDAGDVSLPCRLERQVAFLRQNTDHVAVGCHWDNVSSVTGELSARRLTNLNPAAGPIYSHGEAMVRRAALEACGGYRSLFYFGQDRDLWLRLAQHGRFGRLDEVLYHRWRFPTGVADDERKQIAQRLFVNLALRNDEARVCGDDDIVDRFHALALLTQQPTRTFKGESHGIVKRLLLERRLDAARDAIATLPSGMLSKRLQLIFLALNLLRAARARAERPFSWL